MEDEDELLDVFDEHEQVIQTVLRRNYYKDQAIYPGYLRAVDLLIRNDNGEIWIPRRTTQRSIAPGGLDYSCGGHVSSGESYLVGLLREAGEELNLVLQETDLQFIKHFQASETVPWFREIYLYESNQAPNYNHNDFKDAFWLKPEKIIEMLKAGEPAKDSMLPTFTEILPLIQK